MSSHGPAEPSAWVRRFAGLVPPAAPVLDVACGAGRHARLFAEAGHPVTAIDRDLSALRAAPDLASNPLVEAIEADMEVPSAGGGGPLEALLGPRQFGGVVVTNYLHRPVLAELAALVAPGGVLLYETFAEGNAELGGRVRNPAFLLRHGELLEAVTGRLRVVAYEDVVTPGPDPRAVQRICAMREEPVPGSATPR